MMKEAGQQQFTYTMDFLNANRPRIVERIRRLYQLQPYYPIDVLVQELQKQHAYSIEQIYYALTYLIENRNEFLVDVHGRLGNLINRGEIYAFQPVEISDESIDIFDRTFPVDYKVQKVRIQLNPQIVASVKPAAEDAEEPEEKAEPPKETSYVDLIDQIRMDIDTMEEMANKFNESSTRVVKNRQMTVKTKTNKQEWTDYMHVGSIYTALRDNFEMNLDTVKQYMIHHAMDSMSLYAKLVVANHYLQEVSHDEDMIHSEVRKYMNQRTHVYQGKSFLILPNDQNQLEIFTQVSTLDTGKSPQKIWKTASYTDIKRAREGILQPQQQVLSDANKLAPVVGFFTSDTSKEQFIALPSFKVKDFTKKTTSKNAKGESMRKAGKAREVEILQLALKSMRPPPSNLAMVEKYQGTKYNQSNLSVLLELMMRHDRALGVNPKMMFLTPEEYVLSQKN
jgi:hypothetical protein